MADLYRDTDYPIGPSGPLRKAAGGVPRVVPAPAPVPAPDQTAQGPVMDQPPPPVMARRDPNQSATNIPGIFKVVGPGGSVTYTDQPGGTFDSNKPLDRTPQISRMVPNALRGPGVMSPEGEMGTGSGNFSAASVLPAGGTSERYRPPAPAATDTGTMRKLQPGTLPWVNANKEAIDPLSSPEAAGQYAMNRRSLQDFRRGDGDFNKTIYDPSGYQQSQALPGGAQGGMNSLDAIKTLGNLQDKDRNTSRKDAEFVASQGEKGQDIATKIIDAAEADPRLDFAGAVGSSERRRMAAEMSLPALLDADPTGGLLHSREGMIGQQSLAQRLGGAVNPGVWGSAVQGGPGPQQFGRGDLADFSVEPVTGLRKLTSRFAADIKGPAYSKDGATYRRDPNGDTRYSLFGRTGSAPNEQESARLYGEDLGGLSNHARVLSYLRQSRDRLRAQAEGK